MDKEEPEWVAMIGNWGKVEWRENVFPQLGAKLYSAPPKKEWIGLPDEKEILEMSKDAWGRALLNYGRDDHCSFYVAFARAIETYLKEKNT